MAEDPFDGDRALLLRFRAGDPAALEQIYWAYVDLVGYVVRRSVRGEAAADLIQETFARAFAERGRLGFDGLRPYKPYLLTICRNLLVDWARKHQRELPAEALAEPADGAALATDEAWADRETMALVERYVAGLEPGLRAVYQCRYVEDLSQNETAERLRLSRQRVRTLEDKLRDGLAKILNKIK